jgi:TRAP-type mannitol/chloroaromatic compound transport system permease small subunit
VSLASLPLRVLNGATQGANILGTMLIVGLVIIICTDVLGRNLFGVPLPGVPEMISLSIVAIVFLQVPQALKAGRLTRSDGLINTLHKRAPRAGNIAELVFDALGFLVVATIIYAHWPILVKSIVRQDYVGAVGNFTMPVWPAKLMILIGACLLALQFLARILHRLTKGRTDD